MNLTINKCISHTIIPLFYGMICVSILRTLPQVGEVLLSLAIVISVFRSYFTYDLNKVSLPIALAIVFGELVLVSVSYTIPMVLAIHSGIILMISVKFRKYAKNIA